MGSFRLVEGCVVAAAAVAVVKELLLDKLEVDKEDPLLFISYAKCCLSVSSNDNDFYMYLVAVTLSINYSKFHPLLFCRSRQVEVQLGTFRPSN
jgi:hypothetical protein